MVRHVGRHLHVVGDQIHRPAFLGQVLDDAHHFLFQFRVKRRGRLVEQQRLGFHRQRPRDRRALLLATRKLRRVDIGLVADADLVEVAARGLLDLRAVAAQHGDRCLDHVLQDGHVRPQVELLEHHRQVGADAQHLLAVGGMAVQPGAAPLDRFALEHDVALLAVFQQVGAAQQRRLARSRRADQRHHVAAMRREVDAPQHLQRAERLVQVADFDHRGRFGHARAPLWFTVPLHPTIGRKKPADAMSKTNAVAGFGPN